MHLGTPSYYNMSLKKQGFTLYILQAQCRDLLQSENLFFLERRQHVRFNRYEYHSNGKVKNEHYPHLGKIFYKVKLLYVQGWNIF